MLNKIRPWRVLALAAAACLLASPATAQSLLSPTALTKYLDALPNPLDHTIAPTGTLDDAPLYEVSVTQFQQKLHSQLPATTLWGYNGMYPGPTFDVDRDELIKVRWTNNLVDGLGQPLQHILPYDDTLHGTAVGNPGGSGGHAGHGTPYPAGPHRHASARRRRRRSERRLPRALVHARRQRRAQRPRRPRGQQPGHHLSQRPARRRHVVSRPRHGQHAAEHLRGPGRLLHQPRPRRSRPSTCPPASTKCRS